MLKRHEKTDGRRAARWLAAPLAAVALFGCPNEDLAPLAPCTVSGVSSEVPVTNVDMVDLLFVIDNSNSMAQEQAKLARQLPKLVEILTKGERADGTTFTPVRDLHLGVVTSDMGSNGISVAALGNGCTGYGDDGILTKRAQGTAPNCATASSQSGYLSYVPGNAASNLQQTIDTFACLADVGINGCGFEQQLEAMFKAVAPSSVTFAGNRPGNANGPNAGFLRPEAVLAIIHVSDEEDCSVSPKGGNLFQQNPSMDPVLLGPEGVLDYNVRCAYGNPAERETQVEKAGYIHPVERYTAAFRKAVKPLNEDRIIFAAIVGIPDDTEGLPLQEILDHPRMGYTLDPVASVRTPRDVCRRCVTKTGAECEQLDPFAAANVGEIETGAKPAVRFVKIAKDFGDNGLVRSICAKEYDSAVDTIIEKISQQLKGACLPRELNPNSAGIVECDVVEVLQSGSAADCKASRGRKYLRTDDGKIVCSINQVPAIDGKLGSNPAPLEGVAGNIGWYYDTFSQKVMEECKTHERRRISFSPGAEPMNALVKFECFQPVVSSDDQAIGKAAVGVGCNAAGLSCESRNDPSENLKLVCEPGTNTCQIGCEQDSQCPVGWLCEPNNLKVCINPTCVPPEFAL